MSRDSYISPDKDAAAVSNFLLSLRAKLVSDSLQNSLITSNDRLFGWPIIYMDTIRYAILLIETSIMFDTVDVNNSERFFYEAFMVILSLKGLTLVLKIRRVLDVNLTKLARLKWRNLQCRITDLW